MWRLMGLVLGVCCAIGWANERNYDFDFRDMDLYKAVESIGQMLGKNVIFTKGIENKPVTFSLKQVTAETALKALLETQGYVVSNRRDLLYIVQGPTGTDKGGMGNQDTVIIPLVNVIAKDIEGNVKAIAGNDVKLAINEQRNAFIVTGSEETITRVKNLIQELDQELTQIFLEGKIIQTTRNFSRQLGIQWGQPGLRTGGGTTTNADGTTSATTGAVTNGISVSGFDANSPLIGKTSFALSAGAQLEAIISAAEANGEVKVISSPRITTLNGTAATISSGTTITYLTLVNGIQGATASGASEKIKTGTQVTVTPFLVSEEQVRLNISISKSLPGASGPNSIPEVDESSLNTSLIVHDGETASIGGLALQSLDESTAGVPFLSSLPIIGGLFGSSKKTKGSQELLIFMTPTIFRGARDSAMRLRREGATASSLRRLHRFEPITPTMNDFWKEEKSEPAASDSVEKIIAEKSAQADF